MSPTRWFKYLDGNGNIKLVARWYYPQATKVEVNDGSGWREAPLFLEIAEDPSWEEIPESVANDFGA